MLRLADIELLFAFAESRNSIEAAKLLGISQPTFCERLKTLESSLPQSPFSWKGHKRILSPYGQRLTNELLPHVASLRRSLRGLVVDGEGTHSTRFRISGRAEILGRLALNAPSRIRLVFRTCSSSDALQHLLAGEVDVAVTHLRPSSRELVTLKLFEPKATWICTTQLCPSNLKKVTVSGSRTSWDSTLSLPWIAYRENDDLLNLFIRETGLEGVRDSVQLTFENWLIVRELVEAGKGCAVVPEEILTNHNTRGLVRIDFENPNPTPSFFAVYRRELTRSAQGKALVASLRGRTHRTATE